MDALKKGILYICVAVLIFGTGYWLGGRADVSGDSGAADTAGEHISAAQDSTDRAGEANRDAQDTADRLGESNQTIADLIAEGKSILADIRAAAKRERDRLERQRDTWAAVAVLILGVAVMD